MELETRYDIEVRHNFDDLLKDVRRIDREANFQQVTLEGIQAIQRAQRVAAPKGKSGRIPRSIKPARVTSLANQWSAVSRTDYGPAIFTSEGTGLYGPRKSTYQIVQNRVYQSGARRGQPYTVNITHPGIRGTHWWEIGFEAGGKLAIESFKRKVERMLR